MINGDWQKERNESGRGVYESMNEEIGQNERHEEETQIWNLEVYEMPIAENRKNHKKKMNLHLVLPSAALIVALLVVLTVKLQLPRRIALWHPTEATIRKDVSSYLEERYEEKFVITNVIFPSFNYASYIITAYPEGKPQKSDYKIRIQGWVNKGLINYYDNYPIIKLIPEFKEYISDAVGEYFPENKVYVDFYNEWIRENIDKDITLDDFLNDIEGEWHSSPWCYICIPYGDQDDKHLLNKLNKTTGNMAKKNISGSYFFVIMYNYNNLPLFSEEIHLGEHGIDFYNYNYFIDRYGNYSELNEDTEVRENGIK